MRPRGARRGGGQIRPGRSVANGNLARRQIGDCGGDEERRHPVWAGGQQLAVFAFNHFKRADPAAHVYADPACVFRLHDQAGLSDSELRGRQRKLDEAAHLLDFFALDEVFRAEAFDFAGDPATEPGRIKKTDRADAGFSLEQSLPRDFRPHTHRTYQAHPGDDHAPLLSVHRDKGAMNLVPLAPVSPSLRSRTIISLVYYTRLPRLQKPPEAGRYPLTP